MSTYNGQPRNSLTAIQYLISLLELQPNKFNIRPEYNYADLLGEISYRSSGCQQGRRKKRANGWDNLLLPAGR